MTNPKIGFSASKKVGNSVKRHRAVRLMRHAIRPIIQNIQPNHNIILIAKPEILDKKSHDITRSVEKALSRAGLLK